MVAEAVARLQIEHAERRVVDHIGELARRIAARGQVELVGLVDEVQRPGEREVVHRADAHGHFQVFVEIFQGRARLLVLAAGCLLLVHLAPAPIFFRKCQFVEGPALLQDLGELHWVVGLLQREHLRQRLAHQLAFCWVIVKEDQAVQANVEFFCYFYHIRGLVVPVYARGGEVLRLQHHVGVRLEHLVNIGGVILRVDCQDDTLPIVLHQRFLELAEHTAGIGAAQHDARNAVLAHDSAPEGVVQVEHQAFARLAKNGPQEDGPLARQHGHGLRRKGSTPQVPHHVVVPVAIARFGGQLIVIQHVHPRY